MNEKAVIIGESMKRFLLLTGFLMISIILFCQTSKDSMEMIKLLLEIESLKHEASVRESRFWIENISKSLGWLAIIISFLSGVFALIRHFNNQTHERISFLLENLSSDSKIKRLGAARGVSRYIDDVTHEVLAALSTENDSEVLKAIQDSLQDMKSTKRKEIIQANSDSIRDRMHMAGRLAELGYAMEKLPMVLNFPSSYFSGAIQYYNTIFRQGKDYQLSLNKRKEVVGVEEASTPYIDKILEEINSKFRLAEASSNVIAKWISNDKRLMWPEGGIDLNNAILYKAKILGVSIERGIFFNCILKHSNFEKVKINHSCLDLSNFYGSSFEKVFLNGSSFLNANFRNSRLINSTINESELTSADFSLSYFKEVIVNSNEGKLSAFKGAEIQNSLFDRTSFIESEFQGVKFHESRLINSSFFRCFFEKADFSNSKLNKVAFNGSRLNGACFIGTILNDVDFSGADISGADFRNASFSNVRFNNCKGRDKASFPKDQVDVNF